MTGFYQIDQQWYVEDVSLNAIADKIGTPCYVYSKMLLTQNWQAFDTALATQPHQINYAVKANGNLAVLHVLAQLGSGFDIVSEGELQRVLKAGGSPEKIIFSGVGKTATELTTALNIGVGCINVESRGELICLNEIAQQLNKKANIAIRINPDVDPQSHPYISTGLQENKFGVDINEALTLYQEAAMLSHINITGIAFHIGSQITSLSPFLVALEKILKLIALLKEKGIMLSHLNIGGGLGIQYQNETPPSPAAYITAILDAIQPSALNLHIEPGRAIAANAGVLLTRVQYIKTSKTHTKSFAIVDAAMNDLLRPALYNAWQDIMPVHAQKNSNIPIRTYDIVGPVCETADFLGKDRNLALQVNDLLMIRNAGAYGFSMSSNYNARPRPPEVMVDGDRFTVVRPRETLTDLFKNEVFII